MKLTIGSTPVCVEWEDNDSVADLKKLLSNGEITVSMSEYGGFEAVGALPQRIKSNDRQENTNPCDIMLYNSSNIVIFYGNNSWAYTRLGRITDKNAQELKELLSSGAEVTIELE